MVLKRLVAVYDPTEVEFSEIMVFLSKAKSIDMQDIDQEDSVVPVANGKQDLARVRLDRKHYVVGQCVEQSIMRRYREGKKFTLSTAAGWVSADKYNSSSASVALSELTRHAFIERIGRGKYRFLREMDSTITSLRNKKVGEV